MMEKIFSKPPIYLAIVWLAAKIALHNFYPEQDTFILGACANILFVFGLILLNLRQKAEDSSFLSHLKLILKAVSLFVLLTGVSIFIYYNYVDPEYIVEKRVKSIENIEQTIIDQGGWEKFRKDNTAIKQKNLEDYITYKSENLPGFLYPNGHALFSVLGLLLMGIFWSIIFLVVSRKALEQKVKMTSVNSEKADRPLGDNLTH